MKPRPTIRQRLVASLSRRYKVVRVVHPAQPNEGLDEPWTTWDMQVDGHMRSSGSNRDDCREIRLWYIQWDATRLLSDMRSLQRQGFKVTFP